MQSLMKQNCNYLNQVQFHSPNSIESIDKFHNKFQKIGMQPIFISPILKQNHSSKHSRSSSALNISKHDNSIENQYTYLRKYWDMNIETHHFSTIDERVDRLNNIVTMMRDQTKENTKKQLNEIQLKVKGFYCNHKLQTSENPLHLTNLKYELQKYKEKSLEFQRKYYEQKEKYNNLLAKYEQNQLVLIKFQKKMKKIQKQLLLVSQKHIKRQATIFQLQSQLSFTKLNASKSSIYMPDNNQQSRINQLFQVDQNCQKQEKNIQKQIKARHNFTHSKKCSQNEINKRRNSFSIESSMEKNIPCFNNKNNTVKSNRYNNNKICEKCQMHSSVDSSKKTKFQRTSSRTKLLKRTQSNSMIKSLNQSQFYKKLKETIQLL